MITIYYESHAASVDNVARRASGHADVPLAGIGEQQAKRMGRRYDGESLDAVFCSDLQRSYRTAEVAFAGRAISIIRDRRLRELDYGDWTQRPAEEVFTERARRVMVPFPNGESYEQAAARMRSFLTDLLRRYDGKTILIIGHRATHYALEHCINGVPLPEVVMEQRPQEPKLTYVLEPIEDAGKRSLGRKEP